MKNKKRVLHVVGGMNIGGTETMLVNLYRKVYKEIAFDFISYYEEEGYYDKEIIELGGNIIRLNSPKTIGLFKSIKELKNVIKGNYDIVHIHTLFNCGIGALAAFLGGAKIRISHAHTTLDTDNSFIKRIYIAIMRTLIKFFSTNYFACSNSAGKYLFGENIVKNNNYKVIPNYIAYEKFMNIKSDDGIRQELNIDKKDIIVGHVGRLIDAKNHSFLLDIVSEMINKNPNIKCILVGDGVLREQIEEKILKLNIQNNVYLLGIRDDVDKIMKEFDLFIMPSIYEGLGLVLLEAQVSIVPCLVSEAIQPEADLGVGLVKQLNLSDGILKWAEEAEKIISNKNKSNINIAKAIKDKHYDLNSILDNLLSVYKLKLD